VPDSKFVQIRQVWHWFLEQQVSFTLAAVVSVFQYFRIEFEVYKDVSHFYPLRKNRCVRFGFGGSAVLVA
jgi:hypothetical protein